MAIIYKKYEESYLTQVAQLFFEEYGWQSDDFLKRFSSFYESDFQRKRCVRVMAIDEASGMVVGFQAYFVWPLVYGGKTVNSYQSGNSIVHRKFRGQSVFQNLLKKAYEELEKSEADLIIGFPIKTSLPGLLRDGWKNVFNLRWYVCIINPFAALNIFRKNLSRPNDKTEIVRPSKDLALFYPNRSREFEAWKSGYNTKENLYFSNTLGSDTLVLQYRIQNRNRFVREAMIASVSGSIENLTLVRQTLRKFQWRMMRAGDIFMISYAVNESCELPLVKTFKANLFWRSPKVIYFAVKNIRASSDSVFDPKKWLLSRADIDTW